MSNLTIVTAIPEGSEATPGLWNSRFSAINSNFSSLRSDVGYYDVRAFGAVGDGATNDTAAVQAAITACNAAGGGTVYFPSGTYSVTSILLPAGTLGVTLRGVAPHMGYGTAAAMPSTIKARSGASTNLVNLSPNDNIGDPLACVIEDLGIDGNSISANGIRVSNSNLISRTRVKGCTHAGVLLANFTNTVRIVECALAENSGWGLVAQGGSTTPYSVIRTNIHQNSTGGCSLDAGVGVLFDEVIVESNSGIGIAVSRSPSHAGAFGQFHFRNTWLEDNNGLASLHIDSDPRSDDSAPSWFKFENCRFSSATKHVRILCAKWVTFENCSFAGSSNTTAFEMGPEAQQIAFIESNASRVGFSHISQAQMDAAMSLGTRVYFTDRQTRRTPTFNNSWVNLTQATPVSFYHDLQGVVHLQGSMASGTTAVSAFTMPAGFRSVTTRDFTVFSNGSHPGQLQVRPDGAVVPMRGSMLSFSLDGVFWPTD